MLRVTDVRQDHDMVWYEDHTAVWTDDSARPYYLTLVTYGKCVYWVGEDKWVLEKGDLLFIPGNLPFYGKSVPTLFHSKYVVRFSAEGKRLRLPLLARTEAVRWRVGRYEQLRERLHALHGEWTEREPYAEDMAAAMLTEALTMWNREWDRGRLSDDKHRYVEHMKNYMQEHYREKVTKDDLGAFVRLSPNYAATLFRTVTGQTISDCMHALRVKTALHLLVDSRLTVGEIAEFVGYGDVSYFHRIFKRATGRTPSECMEERRQDG